MRRKERKRAREENLNVCLYIHGHTHWVRFLTKEHRDRFFTEVEIGVRRLWRLAEQAGGRIYVRPSSVDAYRFNRG